MTAGWRRRSFPPACRSPRRVVLVVVCVLVLAIIVGEVAADVVNSGSLAGRVAAQTYVAEVIPVVEESTMLASLMRLVRNDATSLDRTGLEADLGRLVIGTSTNLAELGTLGVPAPSSRSGQLLKDTLAAHAEAARTLTGAVELAIGPSPSSPGKDGSGPPTSVVQAREGCGPHRAGGRGAADQRSGLPQLRIVPAPVQRPGSPARLEMGDSSRFLGRSFGDEMGDAVVRRGQAAGP